MRWINLRHDLVDAIRSASTHGLVVATEGNVSARIVEDASYLVAMTPTAIPYQQMTSADIVIVDHQGNSIEGFREPTSEMALHLEAYRARPDVKAAMHTHPVYATVLGLLGKEIPLILDELIPLVGGTVPISTYALSGTQDLANNARVALGEKQAVLLPHHGLLAVGSSLRDALEVSLAVEKACQVFAIASMLGVPEAIPASALNKALEFFQQRNTM